MNADGRRVLAPSIGMNMSFTDEGRSRSVSVNPALNVRASTRLDARVGLGFTRNHSHTQWIENGALQGGGTRHVFAHLDQETVSANVRVNYTAGPDLTVQLYGEPFMSRGDYSDFRALSATPEAEAYEDHFVPYAPSASTSTGFRFRQLRTNLVVRWEYLPGSTLFLAWAHGRQGSGGPTDLTWGDGLQEMFAVHPDNTFLIKVAHWISW